MESHITTIDAITFVTADMRDSVAFYRNLGMGVRYGGEAAQFTSLSSGDCHVNLVLGDPSKDGFWGRVIFFVDDVDATYRQVLAAGYTTETEPADGSWGERYFHVRDPDGNELSFARRLDG